MEIIFYVFERALLFNVGLSREKNFGHTLPATVAPQITVEGGWIDL